MPNPTNDTGQASKVAPSAISPASLVQWNDWPFEIGLRRRQANGTFSSWECFRLGGPRGTGSWLLPASMLWLFQRQSRARQRFLLRVSGRYSSSAALPRCYSSPQRRAKLLPHFIINHRAKSHCLIIWQELLHSVKHQRLLMGQRKSQSESRSTGSSTLR